MSSDRDLRIISLDAERLRRRIEQSTPPVAPEWDTRGYEALLADVQTAADVEAAMEAFGQLLVREALAKASK